MFVTHKQKDKKCNGERPCRRCLSSKVSCEDAVSKKRGRPVKQASDEHGLDPRLLTAHELILRHSEVIFADPVLAAGVFGIRLSKEFFVCEIPIFADGMSLVDFERESKIHFMSEAMCAFLGATRDQYPNQAAIKWLNTVCSPNCVKDAATTLVPKNCVRHWTHKKMFQSGFETFDCDVRGYILPSLKVMFVEIASRSSLASKAMFVADMFEWGDYDFDALPEPNDLSFSEFVYEFEGLY